MRTTAGAVAVACSVLAVDGIDGYNVRPSYYAVALSGWVFNLLVLRGSNGYKVRPDDITTSPGYVYEKR